MSGINPQHQLAQQLYTHVITPALSTIGFNDHESRLLVLATACQESGLQAIVQYSGPAVSLWQMEPATVRDTWYRLSSSYYAKITALARCDPRDTRTQSCQDLIDRLPGDLFAGAAMCRLIYYMKPFKFMPIYPPGMVPTNAYLKTYLAHTWKLWYNSPAGAGTEAQFITNWDKFNLDSVIFPYHS